MRSAVIFLALLVAAPASAQPTGDQLIDRYELAELRGLAGELAQLPVAEPLDEARYAAVIALRTRHPILGRAGALDDADLARIAATLCHEASGACTVQTTRALRCLADRCTVALTPSELDADPIAPAPECRSRRRRRAPLLGVGFDWGTGIQRSEAANDGSVASFGISARLRLSERYGFVVRADRTSGRDEATDLDGDGVDDFESSSITRFTALAGPTIVLDSTKLERSTRSVRLDLLAGYQATKTLPGEDGLAVGADLAMQLSVFRTGMRVVQGLGAAKHGTTLLVHLGFAFGATPIDREDDVCPPRPRRSSRLALGVDMPILGGGFSSQLGVITPGFGGELLWHVLPKLDAVVHADLLPFPRAGGKDRVLHQAALVGVRVDHHRNRRNHTGWFSTLMAGVTHGAELEPSTVGTGPVVDASLAWGAQDDDFAGYFRLHGRLGLSPDNEAYRAVFLSVGFEMRFDRERWRDRERTW